MDKYPCPKISIINNLNGHSYLIEEKILSDGRVEVVKSKNLKTDKLAKIWQELRNLISE